MAEIVPNRVPCGKKIDPTPTPTPTPPVVLCELDGVTYFKLRSDIPGDYTKNCGLLGDEIDKNFYFLRSMDILSAHTVIEDDRKYLILDRINCGREIKVDITDEKNLTFRVEDGYIYVRYPGGEEDPIRDGNGEIGDGNPVRFLVEGDNVRVVTDASIQGDGSYGKPIGVDLAYRTGTYAPADFYADLTCPDVTINDVASGIGYGHAVITRENASRFGALYTWWQAMAINAALNREGRGWRLPSKKDWAKLLNWAELNPSPCVNCGEEPANFNHDTDKSGNFGCNAGARLKATTLWENKERNTDDFGFTIYPVGICPEDYNTKEPTQYGFTGLYKVTTFWTSSTGHTGEPYVRTFSYGHDDVAQFTESPAKRFSIRLVRDIEDDFDVSGYAEILGSYTPVVLTTDGKQQWTQYNIDFTGYEGYKPEEVTVPEAWKDIDTEVPAKMYYELFESGDTYGYAQIDEYDIPSTATPVEFESVEEALEQEELEPYIVVPYTIHLDMTSEPKFYYNAWDGNQWHKKMMREGESVVIIGEDFETGCDTAATPYVTSANTNHEWRIFANEQTGLDELIDTVEALKKEIQEELDKINERIDDLSATTKDFSAATVEEIARLDERIDNEEARAISAETELHERINALEIVEVEPSGESAETILRSYQLREGDIIKGVTIDIPKDKNIKSISTGWSGAVIDEITGEYIYDPESGDTEVVRVVYQRQNGNFELVEIDIEDFIHEDEFASGITIDKETHIVHGVVDPESEDFLTVGGDGFKLSGVQEAIDKAAEELWEALSAETAERIAADEELWEGLSAETAERIAADEYLQEQIDELKSKTIEPLDESIIIEVSGNTTSIGVALDPDDEHLKLGPNGLWIDPDFGEFGE